MAGNEILAIGDEQQAELDAKLNEAANNNGTNGNLSTAPEVQEVQDTPSQPDTQEAPEAEVVEETEEVDESVFYFGDVAVEVEVPAEISEALKSAKIDEATLLKELFAKDGKFEVSEETKKALDKAFGKQMVDGYLNLFRQQNQMSMDGFKRESEELAASIKANSEDFDKLIGGDEGWDALAEWAGSNLSEQELSQFNAVMQLPPQHYAAQRAVVEALKMKQAAAQSAQDGDSQVTLPTDGSAAPQRSGDALPSTLTMAEFQATMATVRYKKDPAYAQAIDNIRRASKAKGIK